MRRLHTHHEGNAWEVLTFWGGRRVPIKDLIGEGSHKVECWGNSGEGWQCYLVSGDSGVPVSPHFHRDYGDTRRMLYDACERAYGVRPKAGRNWL